MKRILILPLMLALAGAGRLAASPIDSLYLLGGFDEQMLAGQYANDYFNLNSGQLGSLGVVSGVLHGGLQLGRFASVELSADWGKIRNNDVSYHNGPLGMTRQIQTQWSVATYSVTPAFTFAAPGWVGSLGLRMGLALLGGRVVDNAYGVDGAYDQNAMTPDIGIVLRGSRIFAGHFSLSLEAGYDRTVFGSITDTNGTGSYQGVGSPEHNVSTIGHNGDQSSLDYSGPHIAILIGLWSSAPGPDAAEPDKAPAKE